jgi:c-di-GMP-binding flagellar brake protein YcgR
MSTTHNGSERRKHKRIQMSLAAKLRHVAKTPDPECTEAVLRNISLGGAFFETVNPFQKGNCVTFEVQLPGINERVTAVGIVRRCQPENPPGIGVEFIHVADADKVWLKTTLRRVQFRRFMNKLLPGLFADPAQTR